jgi:hypothetical protein
MSQKMMSLEMRRAHVVQARSTSVATVALKHLAKDLPN